MMSWLRERFLDIFSRARGHRFMPYERSVCLWAWNLRLVFVLVPAFGMAWWWSAWWEIPTDRWELSTRLWAVYTVWGAGWLGGFVWADCGPGEWFVKSFLHKPRCPWALRGSRTISVWPWNASPLTTWFCCGGTSYQPNIVNTTLEGWEGPKERHPALVVVWQRHKYARLRAFDGDPASGRFGDEE